MDAAPSRRWFQFRLRTLLALTTITAVALGWFLRERRWIAEQQRVLRPHVWSVIHTEPDWRDRVWGYDSTHYARRINTFTITDDDLRYVQQLPRLRSLEIFNNPQFTGRGLEHLRNNPSLESLTLEYTGITDAGLEHLRNVTPLPSLQLYGDEFTGEGFAHFARLTQLKRLDVRGENITDEGLKHLGRLTQLGGLTVESKRCTDVGLKHLHGLTQLEWLSIDAPEISDAGIAELQRALPNCAVSR